MREEEALVPRRRRLEDARLGREARERDVEAHVDLALDGRVRRVSFTSAENLTEVAVRSLLDPRACNVACTVSESQSAAPPPEHVSQSAWHGAHNWPTPYSPAAHDWHDAEPLNRVFLPVGQRTHSSASCVSAKYILSH